jgi:hypothetical protein
MQPCLDNELGPSVNGTREQLWISDVTRFFVSKCECRYDTGFLSVKASMYDQE